ncbi:venom serine carboxypeptidase-like [Anticarsia gemmatalis]|uniref:venom serine carboxypeptidase-like n=1 Tax=Anticarsia gemmatalis TaxID=129554 RepID=UPI003F76D09F
MEKCVCLFILCLASASSRVHIANNETVSNIIDTEVKTEPPVAKVDNGTALLLTKYINEGKVKEARAACKVDSNVFLGIKSYSGFFTVNETYNSNIFFWYFPVLNKSVSDSPWIIWLQGGPGVTSLGGVFDEIGPFTVINDTLIENPYTWLQNHSLLFIDNPVGTGYSFTEHSDGYSTDMASYAGHLYSTFEQFLTVFPELKTAPLYLAGESYAGKYVPALAMEIHRRIQDKTIADINYQGMLIGNGLIDPTMIFNMPLPFYYYGLIERKQADVLKPLIDSFQDDVRANRSVAAKHKSDMILHALKIQSGQLNLFNYLSNEILDVRFTNFLKSSAVKRALHVGDTKFCAQNVTVHMKLAPEFLSTTKPMLEELLDHYRLLLYCGQLDLMLPCFATSEHYRTWKWSGTEQFLNASRIPYKYENRLSGYFKSGGNMTEVLFRGAGHAAARDTPAPVQDLVTKWTHSEALGERNFKDEFYIQWLVNNYRTLHYL